MLVSFDSASPEKKEDMIKDVYMSLRECDHDRVNNYLGQKLRMDKASGCNISDEKSNFMGLLELRPMEPYMMERNLSGSVVPGTILTHDKPLSTQSAGYFVAESSKSYSPGSTSKSFLIPSSSAGEKQLSIEMSGFAKMESNSSGSVIIGMTESASRAGDSSKSSAGEKQLSNSHSIIEMKGLEDTVQIDTSNIRQNNNQTQGGLEHIPRINEQGNLGIVGVSASIIVAVMTTKKNEPLSVYPYIVISMAFVGLICGILAPSISGKNAQRSEHLSNLGAIAMAGSLMVLVTEFQHVAFSVVATFLVCLMMGVVFYRNRG